MNQLIKATLGWKRGEESWQWMYIYLCGLSHTYLSKWIEEVRETSGIENKRLNKKEFSLSAWLSLRWDIDLPCLCIHTQKLIPMVLLVLALRRKVYHRLFWVWVSQPPRLQEPIPYHKSLLNIYIYTHSCAHICIFPPPIVSVSLRQTKNNLGS